MKRLFVICLLFNCLLGCKKSPPPFVGYLKLDVDGFKYDLSNNMTANSAANGNYITFYGESAYWSLDVRFPDAVLGETLFKGDFGAPRFSLFENLTQTQFYAGTGGIDQILLGSGKINFTILNNEYIKGSFQFITTPNEFTHIKKTVTNGEFYIKRKP